MFAMVRAHWIDVGGMSTGFGAGPTVAIRGGGAAARPAQDLRGGQAQRHALSRAQGQHPLSESSLGDMKSQMAACRLPRGAWTSCSTIRPRHHPRGDRADLRRDRDQMPQRGVAARGRRLRSDSRARRGRRNPGRAGPDPRQGHHRQGRDDHRSLGLLARAPRRSIRARRRARGLQGAHRPLDPVNEARSARSR